MSDSNETGAAKRPTHERFRRDDGSEIAFVHVPGDPPTVVFLGGYSSDMSGTKARFLEDRARSRGRAFLRFDYQGHGESSGEFAEGGIGLWSEDARAVIEHACRGPLVLAGSSMGAWIMLLVARKLENRVVAMLGIASAPDFSEDLMVPALSKEQSLILEREGVIRVPSRYSDQPQVISRRFLEESRRHLMLRSDIPIRCPVRLLHGLEDPDVPWETSLRLARALQSPDVQVTLIKGGDHRLSGPKELAIIDQVLESLVADLKLEDTG